MINQLSLNKKLWLLVGFMSLIAAVTGVLKPTIYNNLVSEQVMPGVMSQDIVVLPCSFLLPWAEF